MKNLTRMLAAFAFIGCQSVNAQSTEAYRWKPVAIGGGGYYTGVEFAPSRKDRLYLRSDVAGPWRRDAVTEPWTSCNFERAQTDPYISAPCAGLAVHPTNADVAFANFTMDYSKADDLYRTTDGGKQWTRVLETQSVEYSKNAGRQFGPNVAVDPLNPNVVYFRTKTDGLHRSTNAGETTPAFTNVLPQQTGEIPFYSRSVVIDPAVNLAGRSQFIYVTVAGLGVYRSENGGDTFALMPGSPTNVRWMRLGGNGRLYIAGNTGAYRCDDPRRAPDQWKDITPRTGVNVAAGTQGVHRDFPTTNVNRGVWGLAADPANSDRVVITGLSGVPTPTPNKPDRVTPKWELWRSTDAGDQWVVTTHELGASVKGWFKDKLAESFLLNNGGLALDPFTPGRAYLFTVYQLLRTEDIWSSPAITWELDNRDAENVIPLTLATPPAEATGKTAPLYSGVSDVRGCRHIDLDQIPETFVSAPENKFGNDYAHSYVTGYDYAENNPLVMMATKDFRYSPSNILRSGNGGQTWELMPRPIPNKTTVGGDIALSLDGSNVVFAPAHDRPVHYSTDGGTTWNLSKIAGTETPFLVNGSIDAYDWDATVRADRVKDKFFYAFSTWKNPGFYTSADGGATWTKKGRTSDGTVFKGRGGNHPTAAPVTIAVCPGKAGEIWLGLNLLGIWKSSDFGETFTKVGEFTKAPNHTTMVAFGKAAPGNEHGTVYVYGKGSQGFGTYRSTDLGANWTYLTGFQGTSVRVLAADRQVYGRVYLGEGASGILYGVPAKP